MSFTSSKSFKLPWKRFFSSFMAFIIMIILAFGELDSNFKIIFYIIGILVGSYYFSIEALEAVFLKRKINIDVLMVLAFLSAGVLFQFVDGMMLIFLYSITETLESITKQRTRTMIRSLIQLVPKEAILIRNSSEESVLIDDLQEQDIIKIRSGERIPVDGVIIEGHAYIDESSITGENLPIYKTIQDNVLAGTIVTDSLIKIRVEKRVQDSTVAKLITLVEEAQKTKHPLHLLVNKFTDVYNPIIVFLTFLIFLYGILSLNIEYYGTMAAAFLVAGAPCALAIGTPVTVIAAIGSAGRNGILVKGGAVLEQLAEIETFAFDKTGTLTFGSIEVIDVISLSMDKENLLAIALGLESSSTHPFASALHRYCDSYGIIPQQMKNLKNLPGSGIEGILDGITYFIGKNQATESNTDESNSQLEETYNLHAISYSIIFRGPEKVGIITYKDVLRDEAKRTITEIQRSGFQTYMLTGDKSTVGLEIGKQLGIQEHNIYTELTPKDKMELILKIKQNSKLAMLGDGINDAPALASADLGIAMGVKGSDVAIETADISFMSEDISILVKGINIAKKMKSVLRQNIILSTAIIIGVLFGVLIGQVSLTLAIFVHEGSEVLIIGNSLRLLSKVK